VYAVRGPERIHRSTPLFLVNVSLIHFLCPSCLAALLTHNTVIFRLHYLSRKVSHVLYALRGGGCIAHELEAKILQHDPLPLEKVLTS
jgi:hypothetical protein